MIPLEVAEVRAQCQAIVLSALSKAASSVVAAVSVSKAPPPPPQPEQLATVKTPALVILQSSPVIATLSKADPMEIVSAAVLSVPIFITLPLVLVPMAIIDPALPPFMVMSSVAVKIKSSVEVMFTSPVPDWIVMACVVVVLPIVTAPVEVPVAMLTAKLLEALRLIAAPLIVAPRFPVNKALLVIASEKVKPAPEPDASKVTAPAEDTLVVYLLEEL